MSKKDLYIKAKPPCLNANKLPTKSGQSVIYATGDDGGDQRYRESTFFHLFGLNPLGLNPFGNNRRFTGTTGGYHVNSDNTFRDKDGNITTKALAFPDNLMLDWAYYNGDNLSGQVMMWHIALTNLGASAGWLGYLNFQTTASFGGYSGWKLPNVLEYTTIRFGSTAGALSYQPFNYTATLQPWTNETGLNQSGVAIIFNTVTGEFIQLIKTNTARRAFYNRLATYTVTGTIVTIS
jgi:hypothetical protein